MGYYRNSNGTWMDDGTSPTKQMVADGVGIGGDPTAPLVVYVDSGIVSVFDGTEAHAHDIEGGGVVIENINASESGTVYQDGAIVPVSGLISNTEYYSAPDGTLCVLGDIPSDSYYVKVGYTLSSTQLRLDFGDVYYKS